MKLLGAILVMTASCGIGFLYAGELKKRKTELEELHILMKLFLGDIRYMRTALPEAISKAMLRHQGSYSAFLQEIADVMSQSPGIAFSDIWKTAVVNSLRQSSLNDTDKQRLIRFGETISYADRESIISCFEQYIEELREEINETHRVAGTKAKLYRSLGVLAGVFIVVLFI